MSLCETNTTLTDAYRIVGVSADGEQPYVDIETRDRSRTRRKRIPIGIGLFSDIVPVAGESVLLVWNDAMLSHIPIHEFDRYYATQFHGATVDQPMLSVDAPNVIL